MRFIPQLKKNFVSLGALEAKGYVFKFKGGVIQVIKDDRAVMQGIRKNILYYLEVVVVGDAEAVASKDTWLWDDRAPEASDFSS